LADGGRAAERKDVVGVVEKPKGEVPEKLDGPESAAREREPLTSSSSSMKTNGVKVMLSKKVCR